MSSMNAMIRKGIERNKKKYKMGMKVSNKKKIMITLNISTAFQINCEIYN